LQEEIIRDSLAGRDTFALLRRVVANRFASNFLRFTRDGLTVVVSPLIALMKDQVDSLQASGIAATFLNSSLTPDESRNRLRGLHNGEYRLLYVAPERLMLSGFFGRSAKMERAGSSPLTRRICISEWGHDFSSGIRQIANLRKHFFKHPVHGGSPPRRRVACAKTSFSHLKLHEPKCYVASFNRRI